MLGSQACATTAQPKRSFLILRSSSRFLLQKTKYASMINNCSRPFPFLSHNQQLCRNLKMTFHLQERVCLKCLLQSAWLLILTLLYWNSIYIFHLHGDPSAASYFPLLSLGSHIPTLMWSSFLQSVSLSLNSCGYFLQENIFTEISSSTSIKTG